VSSIQLTAMVRASRRFRHGDLPPPRRATVTRSHRRDPVRPGGEPASQADYWRFAQLRLNKFDESAGSAWDGHRGV